MLWVKRSFFNIGGAGSVANSKNIFLSFLLTQNMK